MNLNVEFARAQFPGLAGEITLADNAGGSVPVIDVIEAMDHFMRNHMVQLGANHPRSIAAGEAVDDGRAAIARYFGRDPGCTVIGSSTTTTLQTLARALAPTFDPGDEIIVTNLDHEANIGPWRRLESQGVVIREWCFDPTTASLRLEDLEPLLNQRTRLVAFTHVSNVVGAIHDVARMTARIRQHGALSVVDGVAYAPHRPVEFDALGADAYVASLYKVFGPHQGVLVARREVLERARGQYHCFHPEDLIPGKLEPGNVNYEAVASLVGIPAYVERLAAHHDVDEAGVFELMAAHESALAERLLASLRARDDATIVGPERSDAGIRVPTVAFTLRGHDARDVVDAMDAAGVAIRHGHFYAQRAVEAMDLPDPGGLIRVSLLHYNTMAEVDRILDVLAGIGPR